MLLFLNLLKKHYRSNFIFYQKILFYFGFIASIIVSIVLFYYFLLFLCEVFIDFANFLETTKFAFFSKILLFFALTFKLILHFKFKWLFLGFSSLLKKISGKILYFYLFEPSLFFSCLIIFLLIFLNKRR